jgi:integrase
MASVYKPSGRKKYRAEVKDQYGVTLTISTGMSDRRAAEAFAAKIESDAQRLRVGLAPEYPDITGPYLHLVLPGIRTWDDAVKAYLAELVRQGSPADGDHYRDSETLLKRIKRECRWATVQSIRADQFTEFLGRLAAAGRAPRTQNRYHETLRALLNFCVRQSWLEKSPLAKVRPVKVGQAGRRRLRRAYTAAELNQLCAAAHYPAHALAYRVAAFSGLRWGELGRLQKQDCTPTGERPRWHARAEVTKNGQPIRLPMTPDCAEALAAHWQSLPSATSPLLAVPDKKTFKRHRSKAEIAAKDERGRWADFHSLRYTFCLWMAQHFPIEVVSKLMRHGSLNLTCQIYLDLGLDREGEGQWSLPRLVPAACPTAVPTAGQNDAREAKGVS